jgi:hypothetical protein
VDCQDNLSGFIAYLYPEYPVNPVKKYILKELKLRYNNRKKKEP